MDAEFYFFKSEVHVTYTQVFISCLTENKILLHYEKNTLTRWSWKRTFK